VATAAGSVAAAAKDNKGALPRPGDAMWQITNAEASLFILLLVVLVTLGLL
jgi:hypothetical protein